MNVFISWSGARSKAVAELLKDWIRCVLQASRPWVSTKDIDRGALWFNEINDQLKDTAIGIVCLTQENKDRPWILFESGALAKGLSSNRVCTLLIDLQPQDIEPPLALLNHTFPNEESITQLIETLNKHLAIPLDNRVLSTAIKTYWTQFESGFKKAIESSQAPIQTKPRDPSNVLAEILSNTREMSRRIGNLEVSHSGLNRMRSTIDYDGEQEAEQRSDEAFKYAFDQIGQFIQSGLSDDEIVHKMQRITSISSSLVKSLCVKFRSELRNERVPF